MYVCNVLLRVVVVMVAPIQGHMEFIVYPFHEIQTAMSDPFAVARKAEIICLFDCVQDHSRDAVP